MSQNEAERDNGIENMKGKFRYLENRFKTPTYV